MKNIELIYLHYPLISSELQNIDVELSFFVLLCFFCERKRTFDYK